MAYSNGVVTAPVEIYDIQRAIGDSSTDLGTLCVSPNINMWSKFKPVKSAQVGLIDTTGQLAQGGTTWDETLSTQWWRDTWDNFNNVIKYGIRSRRADNLESLFANNYGRPYSPENPSVWEYLRPSGGNFPYRQLDFLQYDHNATAPIGSISAPSSLILTGANQGGWSIDVSMMKSQDDSLPITQRNYITPEDILLAYWGACYFGFALIDQADNQAKIWTTGNRYFGFGNNRTLTAGHNYYVMPFYASQEILQDTSGGNLNPGPGSLNGAHLATIPNMQCPELVIPNGSVTTEDARFSVKSKLSSGFVQVAAHVDARPFYIDSTHSITFNGGQYREVIIYVCQPGTLPDSYGTLDPNKIITSRSFYTYNSPLNVSGGSHAYVAPNNQAPTQETWIKFLVPTSVTKCRVFVYAGNGHLSDNGMTARCSGDAMVYDWDIEPTLII